MENKIRNGQFYTLGNPFAHPLVQAWYNRIPNVQQKVFVEPFAGANNIVKSFLAVYPEISTDQWRSYDLEPEAIRTNEVPEVSLIQQDTLMNFPAADVVITNPPYLAKNSATRMKLDIAYDFGSYQDLYELSLEKMLSHAEYVAAIIPESFLTRKLFKDRLFGFVSITNKIFDDTEFPVGIALWTKDPVEDYYIYIGETYAGKFQDIYSSTELLTTDFSPYKKIAIKYNTPHGVLGLHAVDNTKEPSIEYVLGSTIDPKSIKHSSRAITRIDVFSPSGEAIVHAENIDAVIQELNSNIATYREQSHDIFLTSFKGLRVDQRYRRRMDWKTSSQLILLSLSKLGLLDSYQQKQTPVSLFD